MLKGNHCSQYALAKEPFLTAHRSRGEELTSMRATHTAPARSTALFIGKRLWPAFTPSDSETSLACLLAGIVVTPSAPLIASSVSEQQLGMRAEFVVGRNAGHADVENAHHGLLKY
jgi:hypothetical protein